MNNDNLDRYWTVLLAKCPMIMFTMLLTVMIPSNREIATAAQRMDEEELIADDLVMGSVKSEDETQLLVKQRSSLPVRRNTAHNAEANEIASTNIMRDVSSVPVM